MKKAPLIKRYEWYDNLYNINILLIKGAWKQAHRWLDKHYKIEQDDDDCSGRAVMLTAENESTVALWFPQDHSVKDVDGLTVLVHECFHACDMVLQSRGLVLSESSDEAYAYYIGWMFRECYQRLSK